MNRQFLIMFDPKSIAMSAAVFKGSVFAKLTKQTRERASSLVDAPLSQGNEAYGLPTSTVPLDEDIGSVFLPRAAR